MVVSVLTVENLFLGCGSNLVDGKIVGKDDGEKQREYFLLGRRLWPVSLTICSV